MLMLNIYSQGHIQRSSYPWSSTVCSRKSARTASEVAKHKNSRSKALTRQPNRGSLRNRRDSQMPSPPSHRPRTQYMHESPPGRSEQEGKTFRTAGCFSFPGEEACQSPVKAFPVHLLSVTPRSKTSREKVATKTQVRLNSNILPKEAAIVAQKRKACRMLHVR